MVFCSPSREAVNVYPPSHRPFKTTPCCYGPQGLFRFAGLLDRVIQVRSANSDFQYNEF